MEDQKEAPRGEMIMCNDHINVLRLRLVCKCRLGDDNFELCFKNLVVGAALVLEQNIAELLLLHLDFP